MRRGVSWRAMAWLACAAGGVAGAEDPGARALQQNELQRQQQLDQLRLRMQQQQSRARASREDAGGRGALERLEADQVQRQQRLHLEQQREVGSRPEAPSDDTGAREARRQLELQRARRESERQLTGFEQESRTAPQAGPASGRTEAGHAFGTGRERPPERQARP
ncbi:MAG: hypothetical protein IT529_14315 [Burkholderiales bacterium]|nr:hypothetical protein [Burkholderiales bacterium]